VHDQCKLNADTITSTMLDWEGSETFSLVYSNSDTTTNQGISTLYVAQTCDENAAVTTSDMTQGNAGATYYSSQTSGMACPIFTMNALIQFIDEYKFIFGFAFIGVGIFMGILGFKLFQVALFIVTTIAIAFLILFIFYATFLSDNTEAWVGWLVLFFAVVLGLIGGFLMTKLEKFAGAILAAWGGFLLGVLLNETVMWLANSAVLFWIVNIVMAIIFGVLGFIMFDHAVCYGTAFIGSYMVMKGIGIMAGGFPNIYVLIKMIENNAISSIPGVFYAYLAGIIVLTIICSVIQYKCWLKPKKEKDAHPYSQLN